MIARRLDVEARAERALAAAASDVARGAVLQPLAQLAQQDFASASFEDLDAIERLLEATEEALVALAADAERYAERAAPFARVGAPSPNAAPLAQYVGSLPPASFASKAEDVVAEAARKWAPELPPSTIVDGGALSSSFFFTSDRGLAFRLDVDAKEFQGQRGEFYARAALIAPARLQHAQIGVRPQTFGDDLLGLLHIRRDLSFDHEEFDALYFVSGDEEVLRGQLTLEVREMLIKVSREDCASLDVGSGLSTLQLGLQRITTACTLLTMFAPTAEED